MDDRAIVDCIRGLAAEERRLRDQRRQGSLGPVDAARLGEVEAGLRHMWRLVRQQRGGSQHELIAAQAIGAGRLTA